MEDVAVDSPSMRLHNCDVNAGMILLRMSLMIVIVLSDFFLCVSVVGSVLGKVKLSEFGSLSLPLVYGLGFLVLCGETGCFVSS